MSEKYYDMRQLLRQGNVVNKTHFMVFTHADMATNMKAFPKLKDKIVRVMRAISQFKVDDAKREDDLVIPGWFDEAIPPVKYAPASDYQVGFRGMLFLTYRNICLLGRKLQLWRGKSKVLQSLRSPEKE